MKPSYIDIHPHVISDDEKAYPHAPMFGVKSGWSDERHTPIEGLVKSMDEAGVGKAAIVQASTCYGYDNSYVCDAIAAYPGRFVAVGSVDLMDESAPATIRNWVKRGLSGLRLFTGGSTQAFDNSKLDDRGAFAAWKVCADMGLPICLQTVPSGHAQIAGMAKRFPNVKIVLDHLSRPEVDDGPPYTKAASLFALSAFDNIYLKLTPRAVREAKIGSASADTFFPKLVSEFGAERIAWGSNFPATKGSLKQHLEEMKVALSALTVNDKDAIFFRTAQIIYPALSETRQLLEEAIWQ
ncbi:MAG: amidohydrolase family protein [Phyllobacterium sp.]